MKNTIVNAVEDLLEDRELECSQNILDGHSLFSPLNLTLYSSFSFTFLYASTSILIFIFFLPAFPFFSSSFLSFLYRSPFTPFLSVPSFFHLFLLSLFFRIFFFLNLCLFFFFASHGYNSSSIYYHYDH